VVLKNPRELLGEKDPSIKVSPVKEEFNGVEDLKKQLNDVSSSLNNSLTEVVDKNLNFLSNDYSNRLDKFNDKINSFKEEINAKVDNVRKTNQSSRVDQLNTINSFKEDITNQVDDVRRTTQSLRLNQLDKFNSTISVFKEEIISRVDDVRKSNQDLKTEIAIVEQRQSKANHNQIKEEIANQVDDVKKSNQILKDEIAIVEQRQNKINVEKIKEEVLSDVQNILSGDVKNNIKKLEAKIDIIRDSYRQTLSEVNEVRESYNAYKQTLNEVNEGLLNEPPSTKNSDPLTPLDQNFATHEDLANHYRSFINRIQIQLSTLGGGGAVNIKDMDDVDLSTAQVNNKYLKYDSSSKKWVGADASGGGGSGITTEFVSAQHLTLAGISTFNEDVKFIGNNTNMRWDHSTSDLILFNNTRLEFGDNKDFEIWHGGSHTFMKNSGGDLRIRGDVIKLAREDGAERYFEGNANAEVKLFFNGEEKFSTTGYGVSVTGLEVVGVTTFNQDVNFPGAAYNIHWDQPTSKFKFDDNAQCVFGSASGGDLKIFHQSGNSSIRNETGQFRIAGNDIRLQTQNHSEDYILCTDGGAVQLFYNDVEKLATTNAGIDVTGSLDVSDSIFVANNIKHLGDTDTYIEFTADKFRFITGGKSFLDITQSGASSVVINEQVDYDCDFRVEGLTDEHLIFTDAATDKVGIGSAIPRSKLDIRGDVYVGSSQATGVVLTSPNGTKYRLVVANDGTLSTTAV